ncbi:MAG: DHA2 family efflux MFS transporter permease subunit [Chloroflexota bacterium]|nr:DHA2 family efflux MFS transporter permease subunit [Chloroflexota bacterium]
MKIQYKYAVALTAALALFMAVLDSTIVNVALVSMERDFKTNINSVQWIVTGYILAQAAVIPVAGYFGNRFGIKRVFMIALTIFTLGSLLCGLSPHLASGATGLNLLIVFRLIQGVGGGMLFPLGATIAFGAFPPEERAASSAVIAIPVLFAPALGPTIGGLIVDSSIKWPGVFFINVPVGIITLFLLARVVRKDEKAAPGVAHARFDYSGLVLSIVGVVLVVYAFVVVSQTRSGSITDANPNGIINGWGYWLVWVLLAAGVALLAVFALLELYVVKDPVLDLRLFATRDFGIASIVTWVVRGIVFGSFLLLPIFLQQFQGRSAVYTGLILMAQGIGAIIGIQTGSRLYDRIGPRYLTAAGLAILTGATVWLIAVKPDSGVWFFVPILFLRGIGFGWSNLPLQTVAIGAITGRALPKANSLYNASAQIFSSIGVAVVTTILVQRTTFHASSLVQAAIASGAHPPANLALLAGTDAVSDVFKLLTIGTALSVAVSFLLPRYSLKTQMASQNAPIPATPGEQPAGAPSPALALATAESSIGNGSAAPMGISEIPMPAASAQRFGPPPGMSPGRMPEPYRMPDTTPLSAAPAYIQNGHTSNVEERIASLERMVASLVEAMRHQPLTPAPSVDEGRIAALEQAVGSLDRIIHSMPPPHWHRVQYDRMGATEQRIAALERAAYSLTWSSEPPPPDGYRVPTYDGAPRG